MPSRGGVGRTYLLQRLDKERPDLAEKVRSGDLTAYAAALEAGIVPARFTVLINGPLSIANALQRNLTPDLLRQVAVELTRRTGPPRAPTSRHNTDQR